MTFRSEFAVGMISAVFRAAWLLNEVGERSVASLDMFGFAERTKSRSGLSVVD